jgi:O-antigen/teichoic acid export membrane protein
MLELIAFASFCLSGGLILAGKELILLLFGPNWTTSVYIFQILALKSFTYPVSLLIVNTFLAGGKSKENFWYGNIKKTITLLPLPVAIVWGFDPFLYAVVAAAYLNWILNNWFVTISFKISLAKQSGIILPYLLAFVLIGLLIHIPIVFWEISFPFIGIVEALIFLGIYFAVNSLFKTQGYVYFIDYLSPVWKQLRGKSGRE